MKEELMKFTKQLEEQYKGIHFDWVNMRTMEKPNLWFIEMLTSDSK